MRANLVCFCGQREGDERGQESDPEDLSSPLLGSARRRNEAPTFSVSISRPSTPRNALVDSFAIEEKVELGKMTSVFFPAWGRFLFYVCLTVYLYGDLAIYGTAVAKSLRDVSWLVSTCEFSALHVSLCTEFSGFFSTFIPPDHACDQPFDSSDLCWEDVPNVSRGNAYRIFLVSLNSRARLADSGSPVWREFLESESKNKSLFSALKFTISNHRSSMKEDFDRDDSISKNEWRRI